MDDCLRLSPASGDGIGSWSGSATAEARVLNYPKPPISDHIPYIVIQATNRYVPFSHIWRIKARKRARGIKSNQITDVRQKSAQNIEDILLRRLGICYLESKHPTTEAGRKVTVIDSQRSLKLSFGIAICPARRDSNVPCTVHSYLPVRSRRANRKRPFPSFFPQLSPAPQRP